MKITDVSLNNSLFGATATTIAGAIFIFELLTFFSIAYYVMIPLAHRSADDLAAFITVSAHTWSTISPDKRATFEYNLEHLSGLRIERPIKSIPPSTILFPYITMLQESLAKRSQNEVVTSSSKIGDELWYWLDTSMDGQSFRFGVTRQRLGISPPTALIFIAVYIIASTLLSTLILVRRVTRPLSKLAQAASQLEHGAIPEPLPETGIKELASMAHSFNRMALEVSSLLSNRTTLLTGIAHDLRTPLARIRLSLALFPKDVNPKLIHEIELDIRDMTCLIEESLAFGTGVEGKEQETVNVCEIVCEVIHDFTHDGNVITMDMPTPSSANINTLALRRIIMNLLSNALRYGENSPISVSCVRDNKLITIRIRDHGIGIPDDEIDLVFEPFYRVDKSRNPDTGSNGLGLAIAKQLADANDWTISLRPTPGGGVTALLEIPLNA